MKQAIQVTFDLCEGYLRATCTGVFPTDCRETFQQIRLEAVRSGNTQVFLDCRGITEPLSEMDRFEAGVALAEVFGCRIKVAVLYHQAYINKFAENVAVNRGADVLVSGDSEVALVWLLGKEAVPATNQA